MSDFFRIPPLRLLGYGYAVGEAMRYAFPASTVDLAYNVGTGFMVIHVFHAAITGLDHGLWSAAVHFGDAICWETLASSIIPTFLNIYICRFVAELLWDCRGVPRFVQRFGPFLVGVATIPMYVEHVDPFVARFLAPMFRERVHFYTA